MYHIRNIKVEVKVWRQFFTLVKKDFPICLVSHGTRVSYVSNKETTIFNNLLFMHNVDQVKSTVSLHQARMNDLDN